MKITVFGAGAIGGHLGALLSRDGVDVSLVARGAHLDAMRSNGLTLVTAKETFVTHPRVTDDPSELGPQDYVVLSLKSHQAPGAVPSILPLLGPDTTVANAMNGVPWWYFYKLPGPWEDYRVRAVDPDGALWDGLGPQRAIGCITYVASEVIEPGVVRAGGSFRYEIGEPDGTTSSRCQRFADAVARCGIDVHIRPDIRKDIWVKLMGNVAYNPVSALTMATSGAMVGEPDVQALLRRLMEEVVRIGTALGADPEASIDARIEGTRKGAAHHKTSMLQDLERERMMEIDPIIGAAAELARLAKVETPTMDTVLALVRLRAQMGGLLPTVAKS
ncbi:MAG: 2-dehydropantoate 2-reductase [Gammaproteobacteria bacterium]|nr:2-dehydropantoate 2-reductase [Gammaproteobacteria bacterium]